ncbi:MAG: hypothetical protein KBH07_08695 [Flavobacteriales bacterium]|nr:hypothetical protein [Flavobacteriales bacterium]MBP9080165.1 hypothetical protein [Flavobacteriales bacterium]
MAHKPLPVLFLALSALASGGASAQEQGRNTKVLLYKDRLAAEWDTVNCVKNVFKVNPLLFLRGEVPLYYERALSHRVGVEAAVGLTTRNFMGGDFSGDVPDDFSAGTRIIAKPSAQLGFRWYLTDDLEPQGVYVQCGVAYLDHSKDIFRKDSTGHLTDAALRDQRIYNDVRLHAGYQRLSATSNWLLDVYGGLGFRNRAITQVHERLELSDRSWHYSVEERHDRVLALFLGVKVGYGF